MVPIAPPHQPQDGLRQVCIDCREVVFQGESCSCEKSHRVGALDDPNHREELLTEVWGPKPLRRRMIESAKAGGTGGAAGGLLEACSSGGGCDLGLVEAEMGAVFLAVVAFAAVFVLGYWVLSSIAGFVRRRRAALKPRGARRPNKALGNSTGQVGTVLSTWPGELAPISSTRCVASCVELTHNTGRKSESVMLRQSRTSGFDVLLDCGSRVRVAAGPVVFTTDKRRPIAATDTKVARFLGTIDPLSEDGSDLQPFPRDGASESVVRPGDRVEILNVLHPQPDVTAPATGFREPPVSLFTITGIPHLRVQLLVDGNHPGARQSLGFRHHRCFDLEVSRNERQHSRPE